MSGALKYHHGHLARDRRRDQDVDALAYKMQRLAENGEVHLMQRRAADGDFEYWAVPKHRRVVEE